MGNIKEANVTGGLWAVLAGAACLWMSIYNQIGPNKQRKQELHFPTVLQETNATFPFIVHDCMETALPLRAHRMGGLVDRGSPDNTTWPTLNLISQLETNHARW